MMRNFWLQQEDPTSKVSKAMKMSSTTVKSVKPAVRELPFLKSPFLTAKMRCEWHRRESHNLSYGRVSRSLRSTS